MAGRKSDNNAIERVCAPSGFIDVEFDGERGYLGIVYGEAGASYGRVEFGGTPYIDDLIGALQRLREKVKKYEE